MNEKAERIKADYEGNTWLITRLTEGLTHADSVLQPPFPANCLNWILGHILSRRNTALTLLQSEPIWEEATLALYKTGSAPITNEQEGRHWDDLLAHLAESQQRLETALQTSTAEDLARIAETDRGMKPVWEHLEGLHWHETYHMGQLEMLRVLALSQRETKRTQTVTPQFRIIDEQRSIAFYVGGLGFEIDWEHRFEPGFPVFMQLTRAGQTIFLTEHAGDCEVGGAAYFVVPDVDACYKAFVARGVVLTEPPEDAPWGSREMVVTDPDGNRLRFASPITS